MSKIVYNIEDEYVNLRIDRFLSEQAEDLSRTYIQKLISDGNLLVNSKIVKSNYKVKSDDIICFEIPENIKPEILPENIPLDILYEDENIIVVNKPKGMVVHPASGHYTGTLVNALMYHCDDLSGINGILRPGIVHRIDKDTSGVLVCAKNDIAHRNLTEQFKVHSIKRKYSAIVLGTFNNDEGSIEGAIGRNPNNRKTMSINEKNGKNAVTHYYIKKRFSKHTYVECVLETGRTHQIRVHMTSIQHPLLGDIIYGGKKCEFKLNGQYLDGQTLHAETLGFNHPITGNYMEFSADKPDYFLKLLDVL